MHWHLIYEMTVKDKVSFLNYHLMMIFDHNSPLKMCKYTEKCASWSTDNTDQQKIEFV